MEFLLGLGVGAFLGANFGVVIASVLRTSKDNNESTGNEDLSLCEMRKAANSPDDSRPPRWSHSGAPAQDPVTTP
ncbi:hypothetical protein SAMN05192539_10075 [Paraburkholderia diazotrophica]|uniref:Uncharacterized protein n=1 Tax=Paraburkholderia diazotrophica TaxID=667676 RepID=A0A1H6WBW0_9BURK|nr:hypothetical protein SAMN05192539_10075 [Paraburkholderia diazotrophica]